VLGRDEYESEAMELAGAVSPTVVDRLASTLLADTDNPSEDTEIALFRAVGLSVSRDFVLGRGRRRLSETALFLF